MVADLADVRRRVQEQSSLQIHLRTLPVVEHADLRPVTDADDVAVDGDRIARP